MARSGRRTRAIKEAEPDEREELVGLAHDVAAHTETGPRLSGGDIDADWAGAYASGEESVGGSVATPDQDVVDELGRALGSSRNRMRRCGPRTRSSARATASGGISSATRRTRRRGGRARNAPDGAICAASANGLTTFAIATGPNLGAWSL
jgi:hypothetical protein